MGRIEKNNYNNNYNQRQRTFYVCACAFTAICIIWSK